VIEPTANAEQSKYWNETAGPRWVAAQAALDEQLAPLGRIVMDRLALAPGARVLDVGCGCGDSTLELARRVGERGLAVGADLSAVMLARARERAAAAGLGQARFELAEAQTHAFPAGGFDAVFSRFGVMFFDDPPAAFRNLRRALASGGRVAFVCWQEIRENPWLLVPLMAAAQHVALPPPPAPDAPGPFAFADAGRVRGILEAAGLADVALEPLADFMTLGGGRSFDEVVEFLLQIGPTAAVLRESPPAAVAAVREAVREALAPYRSEGGVRMRYAAWVVTARSG
jgi:SAM-dependent methyltransferase